MHFKPHVKPHTQKFSRKKNEVVSIKWHIVNDDLSREEGQGQKFASLGLSQLKCDMVQLLNT